MKFLVYSLLLFHFSSFVESSKCTDCIASGKHWCVTVNECGFSPCVTSVSKPLNCPELPDKAHAYDDNFVRTKIVPMTAAANNVNPEKCFKSRIPTMSISKTFSTNCSEVGPQSNCFGFTSFDTTQKVLVMSFRGTDSPLQLTDEILDFFTGKKQFFPDAGNIFTYFYDAFFFLWNAGLQQDIRQLKYKYPDYELWVVGHSLGGAIASVAASYVVHTGLFTGDKVKLVTMGQPRTGDYDYATWHDKTFPYSFRIVHHKDIVPHIPPQEGADKLFHHRTEVWYNNNMTTTDPYHICAEADGLYCSNRQLDTDIPDHLTYFGVFFPDWHFTC
ncbi:Fungal lipase-type domain-containing protein [Caenorhabditis elegans]|uniref:Fungal lipase-type domain-containing protein n=1 Tax=Caenorhabditis elegans TaxID=6239 RepID=C2BR92_CAEEL|nr:Fungal lipase-like domain-containing protein [Caenorhabditis elegans]CCD67058.1 Fungal lipase-like domain-containing protein [Caenorhabditis elegans]|eukprot:NP_001254854.1 Uncharacterized protein CELE_C39B5.14 [Caenorhabditis elegans]